MTTTKVNLTRARCVRVGGTSAAQIIDITEDGAVVLIDEERALLPADELVGLDLIVGEWLMVTPVATRARCRPVRGESKDCSSCPAAHTCATARASRAVPPTR